MNPTLCAWWSHRQGLDGSLAPATPAEILERTGWARSVGGAAPYLTLFSRGGITRTQADAAVAAVEIHEIPAARGCTYVVPQSDFALALNVGEPFSQDEMKVARKLGVTDDEIATLRTAVLKALKPGPLDPDGLKKKVGDAARNLGPEGVKKGLTTTLPVALGLLQSNGAIRRVPANGRLDQQRYAYTLWHPVPPADDTVFTKLACKYFSWIGPATIAEFQTFAGLGVKAAKVATEPLKLIDTGEGMMLRPEDEGAFKTFKPPAKPQYSLVSSLDNIHQLRRNIDDLTVESGRRSDLLTTRGSAVGLPGHVIFDRGRLIGRWEFDTETGTIAWVSFIPVTPGLKDAVKKMETFVRDDLGDARGFSLDSPKSRAPRIVALRKAATA
jgi:hypothetical protein